MRNLVKKKTCNLNLSFKYTYIVLYIQNFHISEVYLVSLKK